MLRDTLKNTTCIKDLILRINILPKGCKISNVFKSQEEYEAWKASFYKKIKPRLDKLDDARRKSIESARKDRRRY